MAYAPHDVTVRALTIEPRVAFSTIGLVPHALRATVAHIVAGMPLQLTFLESADLVVARVESDCPDMLLLDTDLLGCPSDLCRFARSLRPDVRVLALAYYWSEREDALHACVDAILHKPARDAEWRQLLRRSVLSDAHLTLHGAPDRASGTEGHAASRLLRC